MGSSGIWPGGPAQVVWERVGALLGTDPQPRVSQQLLDLSILTEHTPHLSQLCPC